MHVTAVDIDYKNASYLRGKYPDVNVLCGDSTLPELCDLINDSSFDIALCNPPFKSIVINSYISSLVFDMTGKKFKGDKVRAEIVFLLLNLKNLNLPVSLQLYYPIYFFLH